MRFSLILFEPKKRKPLKAYKVGHMGVKHIEDVFHGEDDGIETYSYMVHFEDRESEHITDTHYVE